MGLLFGFCEVTNNPWIMQSCPKKAKRNAISLMEKAFDAIVHLRDGSYGLSQR